MDQKPDRIKRVDLVLRRGTVINIFVHIMSIMYFCELVGVYILYIYIYQLMTNFYSAEFFYYFTSSKWS